MTTEIVVGQSVMSGKRRRGRPPLSETIKKERLKEYRRWRRKCEVMIGSQIERWNALREKLDLKKHDHLAKVLLDRFEDTEELFKSEDVEKSTRVVNKENCFGLVIKQEPSDELSNKELVNSEGQNVSDQDDERSQECNAIGDNDQVVCSVDTSIFVPTEFEMECDEYTNVQVSSL